MCISYFLIKWKTENQFKIHFVCLLADESEYTDDSCVVVFKSEESEKIKELI